MPTVVLKLFARQCARQMDEQTKQWLYASPFAGQMDKQTKQWLYASPFAGQMDDRQSSDYMLPPLPDRWTTDKAVTICFPLCRS